MKTYTYETTHLNVECGEALRRRLEARARRDGKTLSATVRGAIQRGLAT